MGEQSNVTRVLAAIELLGNSATTANIVRKTGLATTTVERWAKASGLEKTSQYGGAWLSPDYTPGYTVPPSGAHLEIVEALNRIADLMGNTAPRMEQPESSALPTDADGPNIRIELRPGVTEPPSNRVSPAQGAIRKRWLSDWASYLFQEEIAKAMQ